MKLEPLGNRVVLKKEDSKEKTNSGIILPETAEEKRSQQGLVVALGKGRKLSRLNLKKGNKVLFKEFGPTEIEVDKVEYLVADHDDILAIIK
jgi:chaperonin GroES